MRELYRDILRFPSEVRPIAGKLSTWAGLAIQNLTRSPAKLNLWKKRSSVKHMTRD
ncbi:MAG: hypothetical protein U0Q18_33290 [Bryobacteraceae bacterium]